MDGDGCLFYPDGIIILQHGINSKSYTSSYQSERCGDTIVHPMKWGLRSTATCLFWCLEDFMFFKYQVQGAESLLNPEFQVFEHPLLDVAGCSVSCFIMNLYNMHSRYTIHIETCYSTHWLLSVLQISESGDCLLSVSEILSPLLGWKNGGRCFFLLRICFATRRENRVRCLSSLAANLGPSFGPLCKPLGNLEFLQVVRSGRFKHWNDCTHPIRIPVDHHS